MLISSQHLPIGTCLLFFSFSPSSSAHVRIPTAESPYPLAGHGSEGHGPNGMAEIRDAVPRVGVGLPRHALLAAEDHAMHRAPEQAVGPVGKQVADVDEDGRGRVVLRPRRGDGHGGPLAGAGLDFETGLAAETE